MRCRIVRPEKRDSLRSSARRSASTHHPSRPAFGAMPRLRRPATRNPQTLVAKGFAEVRHTLDWRCRRRIGTAFSIRNSSTKQVERNRAETPMHMRRSNRKVPPKNFRKNLRDGPSRDPKTGFRSEASVHHESVAIGNTTKVAFSSCSARKGWR